MAKPDKKQRQQAKRKAKQAQARRLGSVSPIKRLAEMSGQVEYWKSDSFEINGQIQIFIFKQAAGLAGVACFLVDRGVVGLKDAWSDTRVGRADFTRMLDKCKQEGIPMIRTTLDDVRHLVAGGIRWAHDNGMRLPSDLKKTSHLIGGMDDWASADVSGFVKEFSGHPNDLRQRLISEPFETYIERSDIEFDFSNEASYKDQRTGEYNDSDELDIDEAELAAIAADVPEEELKEMVERLAPPAKDLAAETARWMISRSELPSPELFEAWRSVILCGLLAQAAMPDAPKADIAEFSYNLLQSMAGRIQAQMLENYDTAVAQVLAHLEFDAMVMQQAVMKHALLGGESDLT